MIDIETLIEESNPVPIETLPSADSAQARCLFTRIADDVAPAPVNPRLRHRRFGSPRGVVILRSRVRPLASMAIALALVAGFAAVLVTTHLSGGGASGSPGWKLVGDIGPASWSESLGAGYQPGGGLVCPTTTDCYVEDSTSTVAGSSQVEVTVDGGVTWQQSRMPVGLVPRGSLDCVSASDCAVFAVADGANPQSFVFVSTVDSGHAWMEQPVTLPATFTPNGVSCITVTSCVAVLEGEGSGGGGMSMVTVNGGLTWTDAQTIAIQPLDLECFSGGGCVLTGKSGAQEGQGAALYSTNGGTTWSSATTPAGIGPLGPLACESATSCLAIAPGTATGPSLNVVVATTDGGSTWTTAGDHGLPSESQPFTVGCASGSMCWVGGSVVSAGDSPQRIGEDPSLLAVSTDGGLNWQTTSLPASLITGTIVGVSCPESTVCHAMEVLPNAPSSRPVLLSYGG